MPPSSMNDLFAFLTDLMTQHAGMFQTMGASMYRGFAVILIVWFGVKTALAAAGQGHGPAFHFDHFASLLMTIAFGFGMITYYSQPLPGIGVSFYHLIIDQGVLKRDITAEQVVEGRLARIGHGESNHVWLAGRNAPLLLSGGNRPTKLIITRRLSARLLCRSQLGEALLSAETTVSMP